MLGHLLGPAAVACNCGDPGDFALVQERSLTNLLGPDLRRQVAFGIIHCCVQLDPLLVQRKCLCRGGVKAMEFRRFFNGATKEGLLVGDAEPPTKGGGGCQRRLT